MPKPGVLQEVIMSHRNMHINIWLIHMKDQLKISVYARNQIQVTSYNGEMTSSNMLISSKLKTSLRTRNTWYMYIIRYQIKFAVEFSKWRILRSVLGKCTSYNIALWIKTCLSDYLRYIFIFYVVVNIIYAHFSWYVPTDGKKGWGE